MFVLHLFKQEPEVNPMAHIHAEKRLKAFYSYDSKSFTFLYTDQAAHTSVMVR